MQKTYTLYTDGSHFNLDNIAGYGGYIEDDNGHLVLKFSELIEDENLFSKHEIMGIKRGLQLAKEHGIKNLHCYSDEQFLSQICNSKDTATKDIYFDKPILKDIRILLESFESIEFTYIPRKSNKKADKLSREAVLQAKKTLHTEYSGQYIFNNDKFDCSTKYKNKDKFIALNKTFTDYIVINSMNDKGQIKAYYAKKDLKNKTIKVEFLQEKECYSKTHNQLLDFLTSVLKTKQDLSECVICFYGGKGPQIEHMLRGKIEIPKSLISSFEKFNQAIDKFDKVTYHFDDNIIDAVFNPIKKLNIVDSEDILFEAIKILGSDDYILGNEPTIENLIPMKEDKKNDINEIQKFYFSEFLKLQIKKTTKTKEILHPDVKKELILNKIKEVRQDLTSKGVKLKF